MPGKNIRELAGKPLITHSIEAALAVAPSPEDVVVTTDSVEIARIARDAGARVPFLRDAALATDSAGSREVILDAIDRLGEGYDTVVLLQPTSPFRNLDDIRRAVDVYSRPESRKPDMVVSVRAAATNPYYNAYETEADGSLKISKGDGLITRRQDAPTVYEFDGSIYVINADSLRKYPSLARMPRVLPIENTSKRNIDIDTEIDFKVAELLAAEK